MTTLREGDIIQGKYRVERVLGMGGMGVVVAAHHLQLDEKVAIKSLLPQGLGHPEALLRFEREARAAVKIKSEHIARVLDVARFDDGTPYLVMEHLEGRDLSNWLRARGPLSIEQAVELVVQACEAIAEAHTLGIVHRDLKPANLFVITGRDGLLEVKVLDFGISKSAESAGQAAMTRTHSILGSPEYMSPEQLAAPKTVDWRTDIWSIGVTLFELLAGRVPFTGDELFELALKITQEPAPRISVLRDDVPVKLESVILRCLEKDRAARYQDVAELVAALAPFAPSRSQALVERIGRIVHAVRASSLAATAFAQPPPVAGRLPTRRTQEATSWPPQHPVARGAATTAGVMRPLVSPILPPPSTPRSARRSVALGLAAAFVLVMLVTLVTCVSLWRTASRAVAVENQVSQNASAEASSASSLSPPTELSSPLVVAAPALALSSESPPTPSAIPAAFRGTRAVTRATWRFGPGVYRGVIHTNGATGHADVTYVEAGHDPVVVREDLRLQHGSRGWSYVGSRPRYSDGEPADDFTPNVFYMEHGATGTWTFVETCAVGTGMCTRVISETGG